MPDRPAKAPPVPHHPGLDIEADEVVWAGRFPLQRVRFTYSRFDGGRSAPLTWELWRRGRGVAVLPYDPVADRLALIEQFRLPALAAGMAPVQVECAAGLVEPGEDPLATAEREIVEETGIRPDRFEPIGQFLLMQGGCDEVMHLFAARAALPDDRAGTLHGLAAEGEDIRVRLLAAEAAFAMLDDGRIENATTALCLMWLRHHRPRLRAAWAGGNA